LGDQGAETLRVSIRHGERKDAVAIARLSGELGYAADASTVAKRLVFLSERAGNAVFVAEAAEGETIGWVHVFAAHRLESPAFAELGGLVVAQKLRGRSVGRALVDEAEAWARDEGLTGMRVRSNVVREAAHGFYSRLGYVEIKSQAVFHKRLAEGEP
jgi:GNAT superfamily N-acetyltransferase